VNKYSDIHFAKSIYSPVDCSANKTVRFPTTGLGSQNHVLSETLQVLPNTGTKLHVESLILADAEPDSIANAVKTSTAVVESYESLFFDIRKNLNNHGYIFHSVIGPDILMGFSRNRPDALWKYFAFVYGEAGLNAIVGFSSVNKEEFANNSQLALSNVAMDRIRQLAIINAHTAKLDAKSTVDLLRGLLDFKKSQGPTDGLGGADDYAKNVQTFIRIAGASIEVANFGFTPEITEEVELDCQLTAANLETPQPANDALQKLMMGGFRT
jgi:hypothetical protein